MEHHAPGERQNNSDVANDFNQDTGGINNGAFAHQFSPVKLTAPDYPSQLNFYFGINIFDGSNSTTVDLGQGNNGIHNNWFIGSANLSNESNAQSQSAQLSLTGGSIVNIAGGVSDFDFSPAPSSSLSVPEPGTWVLMVAGFLSVALIGRLSRRRRQSSVRVAWGILSRSNAGVGVNLARRAAESAK